LKDVTRQQRLEYQSRFYTWPDRNVLKKHRFDKSLEAFVATEVNEVFFGQTAASRCEGFSTFQELTPSDVVDTISR
jgi:hypothetical protein